MYTEKQLVRVARRENNKKRAYLVVNRLQGKHVPASPAQILQMFGCLAEMLEKIYQKEKLLIVGFAETATAVGAALAARFDTWYIQTTRENIQGARYLYFSESHSHAAEQRLVSNELDGIMDRIDRVLFVEDEITTGNTILHIIEQMQRTYGKQICFSAASLVNGMDTEDRERFERQDIPVHYLIKTDHRGYTEIAERYRGDGRYLTCDIRKPEITPVCVKAFGRVDARRLVCGQQYEKACEALWEQTAVELMDAAKEKQKILVLGTEEFMYPALYAAHKIESLGHFVRFHATTRSPIAVSREETYPLHNRYELVSLYERERKTYLYDIGAYDRVLIFTDSENEVPEGIFSIWNALCKEGNQEIRLIRWC